MPRDTCGYTKNTTKLRNRMSVIQVNKKYRSWKRNLATEKTAMKVKNDLIGLGVVMSAINWLTKVPVEGSSERGVSCTAERLPASQTGLYSTTLLDCKLLSTNSKPDF